MNCKQLFQLILWVILPIFIFIGCSAPATTHTPTPIPTKTPEPTTESVPEIVAEFEITFDGKDCIVTGPTEVPAGKHTFMFIDISDMKGELWLHNLDDGKTIQDCLDLQSEPGEWYPMQSWAHSDVCYSHKTQESNGKRVSIEVWILNKVGEHNIMCYVHSPKMIWFAAPIIVVEAPSE